MNFLVSSEVSQLAQRKTAIWNFHAIYTEASEINLTECQGLHAAKRIQRQIQ